MKHNDQVDQESISQVNGIVVNLWQMKFMYLQCYLIFTGNGMYVFEELY